MTEKEKPKNAKRVFVVSVVGEYDGFWMSKYSQFTSGTS